MTTIKPAPTKVPPPPAYRLLMVPVGLTLAAVVVIFVATVLQWNELLADAKAADPSAKQGALLAQQWGRVIFGFLLAVSWPLTLRRLGRGNTKVYVRCRRFSIIAAVILLIVTFSSSGPTWLRIGHGVLTIAEIGIFAATLHPQMRAWYAANRQQKTQ